MRKDQAIQLAHNMDDAEVRRRRQQIAQRQWDEWGISIPNTDVMLLAEIEHYKVGYGDILVLKDRAEQADRLQAEVEALRGELEAKDKVLEYYGDPKNHEWSDKGAAARTILNQFRKEEIDG